LIDEEVPGTVSIAEALTSRGASGAWHLLSRVTVTVLVTVTSWH
jgi:hypothetical protein